MYELRCRTWGVGCSESSIAKSGKESILGEFPHPTTYTPHQNYIIARSVESPKSDLALTSIFKTLLTPENLMAIGVIGIAVLLSLGSKKGKLSTGKKAGKSERLAALNLALTQIKERKHNKVCFWCGTPNYWLRGNRIVSNLQTFLGNSPTTFFPYAERSNLILGAPGSVDILPRVNDGGFLLEQA